ncbi:hypothetical protein AGLY_011556 [Aphis glycines]|uniref:Uncharacterized protein n=1 Tax=Aphis glycines TaxID=307491 RepID=A0A6G0TC19_APHGL|nr:hypothetical protein AGLY_011556 [Aphis glycines]
MIGRLLKKCENDEFNSLSLSSLLTSEVSGFISSAGCVFFLFGCSMFGFITLSALVKMFGFYVGINERWKIPVVYVLVNHLNSSQKYELINQCLKLVFEAGLEVVSLTFDGCSSNINMAKQLGCNFNIETLKSEFEFKKDNSSIKKIYIFPDTAYMILTATIVQLINFSYLQKFLIFWKNEGLHLVNKLRKQYKMKVKLASQLLSKSVADALEFCKDVLHLDEF